MVEVIYISILKHILKIYSAIIILMVRIIIKQCISKIIVDSSPCETDNGGCEHTCTWRGSGSATCSCVSGVLNADNMNCDGGNIHQYIKIQTIVF